MDAVNHQAIYSPASGPHRARRPTNGYLDVLALLSVVVTVLLIVFISTSDGVDYIHGFGKACDVVHDGWRFHMQCDSVSPPDSLSSSPDYPSGSPPVTATNPAMSQPPVTANSPAVPQVAAPPQPEAPSPVTTSSVSLPAGSPAQFTMPLGFTLVQASMVGSGYQLEYSFAEMDMNAAAQSVTSALQAKRWSVSEVGTAMDGIVYKLSGFGFIGSVSVSTFLGSDVQVTLNPSG